MSAKITLLAEQYRINRFLVSAALKDLDEAKIEARIDDNGNSMKWLVGHLASSRYVLAGHLGVDLANPLGELFKRGAEPKPADEYPSIKDVLSTWTEIADTIERRFEELSDDDLAAPLEGQYPIEDGTVMGAIAFLSLHESYHAGQLAYIRRLHGGDGVVG
jgi:uncharacterized damage-inducible protein DinB